MFDQTFSYLDIPLLFLLIGLEIILSSDNVVAIATIAHRLPQAKRLKGIWIGFLSAFILRALVILFASYFIQSLLVKILGACYLLFISAKFFIPRSIADKKEPQTSSFWKTVLLIEMTDLIFAIDSILAGIALIGIPPVYHGLYPKLWIVYFGGLIGAVTMRFAAGWTLQLLDRFPRLPSAAHLLIGLTGLKLLLESFFTSEWIGAIFWTLFLITFAAGFTQKQK